MDSVTSFRPMNMIRTASAETSREPFEVHCRIVISDRCTRGNSYASFSCSLRAVISPVSQPTANTFRLGCHDSTVDSRALRTTEPVSGSPWCNTPASYHTSLSGQAHLYLADDCRLVSDSTRRSLWSANVLTCVVLRTLSSYGDRTVAATGPHLWNSLPVQLHNSDITYGLF